MNKTAVVYSTKQGSTARYAQWVAEACGADLISAAQADPDKLFDYDTVVYGGGVYAGAIYGISLIKNNLKRFREESRLFVFTVGLTQPGDTVAFEQVLVRNFTQQERERLRFYHFPGALDFRKLPLWQHPMFYLLKKSIQSRSPKNRTEVEQNLLDCYGGAVDFVSREYTKPLIQEILDGNVN